MPHMNKRILLECRFALSIHNRKQLKTQNQHKMHIGMILYDKTICYKGL